MRARGVHLVVPRLHVDGDAAQEALSDKYSKFDEATGEPTHDKEGTALDGKVRAGAAMHTLTAPTYTIMRLTSTRVCYVK